MDRLIKENIEALLQDVSTSKRLGRRLINLAGFLCSVETPSHIQEQLNRLSRLIILQDSPAMDEHQKEENENSKD